MVIATVGLGYVGLSLSVLLSKKAKVYAVDIDQAKINSIIAGVSPLDDPGISNHLATCELNLIPTSNFELAVSEADFVVVCTPTDYDENKNSFDLTTVDDVVFKATSINPSAKVVVKSTVPIGYVDSARKKFNTENIYFSPEFLREGSALADNLNPSRIIIGGDDESCKTFAKLLSSFSENGNVPIKFVRPKEAEAVKLFANTYLAMRVAFFNELDSFCLENGLTTRNIIEGVCLDPRIGKGYNNPSFGYGGYCFPKDTKQMVANFGSIPQSLISAVVTSNECRADFLVSQILKSSPKCVGVYRLSMKTGSDNHRQSAIFSLVQRLTAHGVEMIFYEPGCADETLMGMQRVDCLDALKAADLIIANRLSEELEDVRSKVFTRDVFNVD